MQVITVLLIILGLTEAGLVKTPRTESPSLLSSTTVLHKITPSTALPTMAVSITVDTTLARTTVKAPVNDTLNAGSTETTKAPDSDLEGSFHILEGGRKFIQTTYWSCVALPSETHCGWHEPILETSAARTSYGREERIAIRAGFVVACVVAGLVIGL
ncbi:hypothetical protein HD806DRAFT_487090 [Xylariaceae sp. AK1471]|nr:hypothetical protein HD806DRAFT_487090 [Xylariaceae sp. AK1471]